MSEELLVVQDLTVHFPVTRGLLRRQVGAVRAVDGVSFRLQRGRTLALVGESGCGKTTVGRALVGLLPEARGSVLLHGEELLGQSAERLRPLRRHLQMVFQDPLTSLDPRMTVRELLAEGVTALGLATAPTEVEDRVVAALRRVGMGGEHLGRFPHQFSGGQRQRIGIARALAVSPSLLICDEAVSALDVSIQAQILNLLTELQEELGLACLFITHDLSVVRHFAHEVAVMYLGELVEQGPAEVLLNQPRHPYTAGLLAAVPSARPEERGLTASVLGDVPSPLHPPSGCRFHTRCARAVPLCGEQSPLPEQKGPSLVRCHLPLSPGAGASRL